MRQGRPHSHAEEWVRVPTCLGRAEQYGYVQRGTAKPYRIPPILAYLYNPGVVQRFLPPTPNPSRHAGLEILLAVEILTTLSCGVRLSSL